MFFFKNDSRNGTLPLVDHSKSIGGNLEQFQNEWVLRENIIEHNHEPDNTILSNEIINYLDDFVTSWGCQISPMDVLTNIRQRFGREFDIPSLFHHLSQRFDLTHKSENVEFLKELVKEYPTHAIKMHEIDDI